MKSKFAFFYAGRFVFLAMLMLSVIVWLVPVFIYSIPPSIAELLPLITKMLWAITLLFGVILSFSLNPKEISEDFEILQQKNEILSASLAVTRKFYDVFDKAVMQESVLDNDATLQQTVLEGFVSILEGYESEVSWERAHDFVLTTRPVAKALVANECRRLEQLILARLPADRSSATDGQSPKAARSGIFVRCHKLEKTAEYMLRPSITTW